MTTTWNKQQTIETFRANADLHEAVNSAWNRLPVVDYRAERAAARKQHDAHVMAWFEAGND